MITQNIGRRGVHFLFEDGESPLEGNLSIYMICTEKRIFLCDTHLGPHYMEKIKEYMLSHHLQDRKLIIFNSHSDWDHIWGNSAFPDAVIISHEACRRRIQERGVYDAERYAGIYNNGDIVIRLPEVTFSNKLIFDEEGIEFIYAPGHTIGSAICYDKKDAVVFAGDLIESPAPILSHYDLKGYLNTLVGLKEIPALFISSHSGIADKDLIDKNINYMKGMLSAANPEDEEYQYFLKLSIILQNEEIIREVMGGNIDFRQYRSQLANHLGLKNEELANEHYLIQNFNCRELEICFASYIASLK